ncbi:14430_t:CDS:1, partial [Gigaspora rosea]
QEEVDENEENKEVLSITECGIPDYGMEEIKSKILQSKGVGLANHDDLTEKSIADINQAEVHSKMEVDISMTEAVGKAINEPDKIEDISCSIWTPVSKSSQSMVAYKRKDKLGLTLWDVPTYTRAIHVKKALSYYGKVLIHGVMAAGKSKA